MSYSSSLSNRWKDKDSSVDIDIDIDIDDSSLQSSNHDFTSHEPHRIAASASVLAAGAVGGGGVDVMDFGVLRFGRSYMLRGKLGRYLTAVPEDSYNSIAIIPPAMSSPAATKAASAASAAAGSRVYPLGVMGQGVGSSFDCITFVNIENK